MTKPDRQEADTAALLEELRRLLREGNETLDTLTAQIKEILET